MNNNNETKKQLTEKYISEITRLHALGMIDREISEVMGEIKESYVGVLRRRAGLVANGNKAEGGRRGGAASPHAARKSARLRGRALVERLDTCEKCGMPFSISAPAPVVKRIHQLWTRRHLCDPAMYE